VLLLNTDSRAAFEVAPGDRIAQLVLLRHESPELIEVESLEETVRGTGGFGSSGR
jgi:dUTP pyrophosphatase